LEKTPKTTYQLSNYAQLNYLKYADDEDVPENTGRGSIAVDDKTLPQAKDLIVLNSAGVIASIRVGNQHTPTIPFPNQ